MPYRRALNPDITHRMLRNRLGAADDFPKSNVELCADLDPNMYPTPGAPDICTCKPGYTWDSVNYYCKENPPYYPPKPPQPPPVVPSCPAGSTWNGSACVTPAPPPPSKPALAAKTSPWIIVGAVAAVAGLGYVVMSNRGRSY